MSRIIFRALIAFIENVFIPWNVIESISKRLHSPAAKPEEFNTGYIMDFMNCLHSFLSLIISSLDDIFKCFMFNLPSPSFFCWYLIKLSKAIRFFSKISAAFLSFNKCSSSDTINITSKKQGLLIKGLSTKAFCGFL